MYKPHYMIRRSHILFKRWNSNLPTPPTPPSNGKNNSKVPKITETTNNSADINTLNEHFNPDISSKVSKPSASLPAMDPSLKALLTKDKTIYNPLLNTKDTKFEFNAPKTPKQLYKDQLNERIKPKSKFIKLLPSLIICTGICWAMFTYKYITNTNDPDVDDDTALLKIDKFLPYIISFKYKINDDHYLIELTRKNRAEKLIHNEQLFNGDKLWSIEVMQPDINIVRNYTPLPMYVAGIDPTTKEPHLRLVKELEEEGKFILIVKRYNDGEFSKWLTNKNILDEVKIRGPIIDYKFPYHPLNRIDERPQMSNTLSTIKPDPQWPENLPKPENYTFYGAGTGILPLFQLLYSPNPPKGFIDVFYSLKDESELLPQLKTLNFFAENCGRVKFHYLQSSKNERLSIDNVNPPTLPNFTGGMDLHISEEVFKQKLLREKKLEVQNQINGSKLEEPKETEKPLVIIDSSSGERVDSETVIRPSTSKIRADNAYQQWTFFKKQSNPSTPLSSFAFICGPERYITDVSGKPDLNNLQMKDNGPIGGYLKEKGWDLSNIKRLQ